MTFPPKSINVDGNQIKVINAPISGDVAVTHAGVSTIGDGKITADMLDSTLAGFLFPVAIIGQAKIGFATIA